MKAAPNTTERKRNREIEKKRFVESLKIERKNIVQKTFNYNKLFLKCMRILNMNGLVLNKKIKKCKLKINRKTKVKKKKTKQVELHVNMI